MLFVVGCSISVLTALLATLGYIGFLPAFLIVNKGSGSSILGTNLRRHHYYRAAYLLKERLHDLCLFLLAHYSQVIASARTLDAV